jgi:outer membrane receptor protein involved in Fe transport
MQGTRAHGPSLRQPLMIPALCLAALAAPCADEREPSAEGELETIVVTASRRPEPLLTEASSVSAVSGRFLEDFGARDIRGVMTTVPGLAVVTATDTKYTLRGVSTDVWEEARPATAEYVDETPITNPGSFFWVRDTPLYLVDMDRIEVLRGPQGTLFGSSSMGGTVRYLTRRPSMDTLETRLEGGYSYTTHGESGYSANGTFNVPLQDGVLAMRGVAYYELLGGYVDNITTGEDDIDESEVSGGRVALEWRPNEQFSAIARLLHQRLEIDGYDQHDLDGPAYTQSREMDESSWGERSVASVDIDYVMEAVALHSTTSWARYEAENRTDLVDYLYATTGMVNPLTVISGQDTDDFMQEIRIESRNTGRFDWLAGVYFQHRENTYSQDFPAPGFDAQTGGAAAAFGYPDNLYVLDLDQPVDELAAYGELGWRPTESWRLSIGARWFEFERTEHEQADGYWNGGPTDRKNDASESDVSPRYAIAYTPTGDSTYYAVVSNGYRPGGPNLPPWSAGSCDADLEELGYDSAPVDFSSDELWNYEIGARKAFLDGRLSLAGALYRIDWKNIQTQIFVDCGWSFVDNAGKARNDGVELELSYQPTAAIDVRIAGGYVDARLESDLPGTTGQSGEELPGVADLTGNVSAGWRFLAGNAYSASVRGMWSYVGDRWTRFDDSRQLMQAYDVLDLSLQVAGERWEASLMFSNVLDEDGVVYVEDSVLGNYEVTVRPRTLRLTLQYDF